MQGALYQFAFDDSRPERLDKFLVRCLPDLSRSRLQGLIKEGRVSVNGTPVTKTGFDLEPGSEVQVDLPATQPVEIQPEAIPLNVIFENTDLVVVDKPAGMVVHPAAGHEGGTLVNAMLAHAPDMEGISGEQRPGVVHRLDKDTSGLILVAKNDRALHWLQDQFRLRNVRKVYVALSDGHPPTPQGRIEAAIGRDPSQRKRMAIVPDAKGRASASEYTVLEPMAEHTLFEVYPETGRTHQIRLHLAFLGCPIVGDSVYGRRRPSLPISRQFLHAARLTILLPGESQPRTFESPLPDELQQVLQQARARG
jgi:23S rRNA pseudouridine1911/1915/1917 synthase